MRLSARVTSGIDSPVGTAYARLPTRAGRAPLLDLAQAAPAYPPAPEVVEHVAAVAHDPRGAAYAAQAGLPHLREAFAADLTEAYGGQVGPDDVVVTAGCNQAFCLVAAALTEEGDEVVVPRPVYFNHEMWLRMHGVVPVVAEPGPGLVPRAADVEPLLTPRTRAIVLVTPGNPTGVTVPPDELAAFAALARRHDLALVLDETYRSFRDDRAPAHMRCSPTRTGATPWSASTASRRTSLCPATASAPSSGRRAAARGDEAAGLRRDRRAAHRAGGRVGRADPGAGLAGRAGRRGGGPPHRVHDGPRRAARRVRAGHLRRLLRWVRHPFDRRTPDVVGDLLTRAGRAGDARDRLPGRDDGAMRVSVGNLGLEALDDLVGRLAAFGGRA